jgi:putative flippase GtrA
LKNFIQTIRQKLKQFPLLRKLIKFGFVGFASALVSLGVFWIITLQFPAFNLPAKAIGWIMGFFVGFSLNKLWTYVDDTEDGESYLLKYMSVYGVTFFIYLITNYILDHFFKIEPIVSNIISIGFNALFNFIGTNYLVFKSKQQL